MEKNNKLLILIAFICILIIIIIALIIVSSSNKTIDNIPEDINNNTEITATVIYNSSNKSEYYGKVVTGYDCANNNGINTWKIFYADENNIYLIADDYISSNYCPYFETQITNNYKISLNNIIQYYNGSLNITDERIKTLNNNYFMNNKYVCDSNSIKVVAYMLDTNIWNVYAGEQAEYAIGGPSIEMLLKSYNQKYNVDYQAKSNELGYRISNDGGLTWDASIKSILNINDSLYVINSTNKSYNMCLSSPSCYSNHYIMTVAYNGNISFNSYDSLMLGFRPIVCLKSNVVLKKQDDNIYFIK